MSKINKSSQIFWKTYFEVVHTSLILSTKGRFFKRKNLFFNWSIIWDAVNPLIIVIGLAILVSAGIRGRGFDLEYIVFLFLVWFGLTQSVSKMLALTPSDFLTSKKYISPWIVFLSEYSISSCQLFIRFIICFFGMMLLGFQIEPFHLFVLFILISILGFTYGVFISLLSHGNSFIHDLHGYALQGLFFLSSILIPVPRLPNPIRDILLYNPLVHLFEWVKSPTTGIYYEFIDINYFLNFFYCFLILVPITLYFKNKRY